MQHFKHIAFLLEAATIEGVPDAFQHRWQIGAKKVSDKVVVRLHKSYKRRYCQRCWLAHEKSASLDRKKGFSELRCGKCFFTKQLVLKEKAENKENNLS
ncbi:unnamed protein product [Oikopleura dioica]|uniref:Uncharacterized protein n=1 Tax=Oikopleura dioica TaxID=34765 RepID=E4Z702_OIKDI|nr:unnamed protein product [Oikopleura dioica]